MANNGMKFAEANFFDGGTAGFLTIATSGNTGSTGNALLRLTSVEVSQNNATVDLQSFDSDFTIARAITTQSFEITAEGYFTSSGLTGNIYSGNTTYVSGGYNAEDILELALQRRTDLRIYVKLGNKIKTGSVVIASYSVSSSTGEVQTFSLSLSGSGGLEAV